MFISDFIGSLKSRNFRLFFFGQIFSITGIWMQATAVGWLAWRLTGSSKWLGLTAFAGQIPVLIFGLIGGVVADRVKRHTLITIIQMSIMIQAAILGLLTISGNITILTLFFLQFFSGFMFAFDYPARQSFLMDMVGREYISNAVALNSSVVHGARVIGPFLAGLIIAKWGEGFCFLLNAVSFLFVLAALFLMNKKDLNMQKEDESGSALESLKKAFSFIKTTPPAKKALLYLSLFSVVGMTYFTLMPQMISNKFGGSAKELGIAMSAAGLGALLGAIGLAGRKNQTGFLGLIKISILIISVTLVSLSFIPNLVFAFPILIIIGLSGFLVVAATNTTLQLMSPPEMRGKVMSLFTVTFFGLTPIGSLGGGYLASLIGVDYTMALCGAIIFCVTLFAAKI